MSNFLQRLIAVFILVLPLANSATANSVQYISPVPGSKYNNEKTNIIIGYTGKLGSSIVNSNNITVTGSVSGEHKGKVILTEKNYKLLFIPDIPFSLGEKVTVTGVSDLQEFSFYIREIPLTPKREDYCESSFNNKVKNSPFHPDFLISTDSIPPFTIYNSGNTASGYLFISNFNTASVYYRNLLILNNDGTPKWSRQLQASAYDFKKQNSNLITYYEEMLHYFVGRNTSYQLVDTFACGNGYSTDLHELLVLPDGSAWLMSYDPQYVDMSLIVPGGKTNAIVTGLVLQKIDSLKHVVFQWRSWDHFQITDATHEDLLVISIDYVHGNSIEVDTDNNIIISSRHMDEVTKINTQTGNIIWRLGGKNNQFTFTNDTIGFSHQHFARRLSNGHLMLFDNGNYHSPSFSRVIEYNLNETTKTAEISWQYRHSPDIYAFAMGSAQRLSNGNTLIGWGSATTTLTEVNPAGQVVYELSLPSGQMSYRAYRDEWGVMTNVQTEQTADKFELMQNYPNPFNPLTNIKYQIANNSFVSIKIYDINGREIKNLVNEFKPAGYYTVSFNGSNIASGVYFYKIQAGNFSETKKMVLIK